MAEPTAQETEVETEVETAEQEETEVNPEKALEDDDLSLEDESEPEDSDDETDDAEETEDDGESEDEEGDESDKPEEPKLSDEDKRKAHNREMAEKRIKAKQEREAEVERQLQDYIEEADPEDHQAIAIRQLQVSEYKNTVRANTNDLKNAHDRALNDFEILRDPDPAVQKEIDSALDAFQAQHVTIDKLGNPADVRGDLYSFLQAKADSLRELTGKGARQQANAKGKEKSKAFTPPTRAPKEKKVDADLEAFDEEASRW